MTEPASPTAQDYATRDNRETILAFIALTLLIVGSVFLYYIGQYALAGRHPFEFFADSKTYHDLYSGFLVAQEGLVGVSFNFAGPMLILFVTQGSIYLVMALNVAMFIISILFISRALQLDPVRVAFIQLASPMTLSSLMSVNKEIIVFPVIALLLVGYRYRSVSLVLCAVVISVLARWQLAVFCLALIALYFGRNLNRYAIVTVLLLLISIVYYFMQDLIRPILETVEYSTSQYTEGSGLFERLNEIQNSGLYFLTAPIKSAHLLFSLGLKFDAMLNPIVMYNDVVVTTYCFVNIIIFILLIATRRFRLRNDLIMISVIYLSIFAVTPIYAPRYFYAVTVLWALALAGTRIGILPTRSSGAAVASVPG